MQPKKLVVSCVFAEDGRKLEEIIAEDFAFFLQKELSLTEEIGLFPGDDGCAWK